MFNPFTFSCWSTWFVYFLDPDPGARVPGPSSSPWRTPTLLVIQWYKSNNMLQTIWHHSSVQFSLLLQMVHSVLLSVLHLKTILLVDPDWLLEVFHQSAVRVLKGHTASKMEHSIWKSNENWTEKWCQIVCSKNVIVGDIDYNNKSMVRFPFIWALQQATS